MRLRNIDQSLVSQRESVEAETMSETQQTLDRRQTGISITVIRHRKPFNGVRSAKLRRKPSLGGANLNHQKGGPQHKIPSS